MTTVPDSMQTQPPVDPSRERAATEPTRRNAVGRGSAAVRRATVSRDVQALVTLAAFLLLFVGYAVWLGDPFVNADARMLNVHQNAPILLLAMAALVTLIPGMFDLSIASMATLTTFLTIGLRTRQDWDIAVVLLVCLGVGVAGGLLNGLLVERLGVNTFIATLGTGGLFLGASSVYSEGAQVAPVLGGPQLPSWFLDAGLFTTKAPEWLLLLLMLAVAVAFVVGTGSRRPARLSPRTWLGVRVGLVALLGLAALILDIESWLAATSVLVIGLIAVTFALWVLLQQTTYGRYLRAVGANRAAAGLAGVPVEGTVVRAFVLGGVLAAASGVVLGATQSVAVPNVAVSYLLPAFAAAFLSTVVLSSGHFTVWGTLVGGIFLVWVSQGLILGGLAPTWSDIVNGAVLVVAVGLSSVFRRQRV